MAVQTRQLAAFNGGSCKLEFTFDDVTLAMASVLLTNNGAAGTLTAQISSFAHVVLWSGSRAFGQGTFSADITGLGLVMVQVARPDGVFLNPPVLVQVGWTSS